MEKAKPSSPVTLKAAAETEVLSARATVPVLILVLSGVRITAPPEFASRYAKFIFEVVVIPIGLIIVAEALKDAVALVWQKAAPPKKDRNIPVMISDLFNAFYSIPILRKINVKNR